VDVATTFLVANVVQNPNNIQVSSDGIYFIDTESIKNQIEVKDIFGIFKHENIFVISAVRNGQNCLTRINFDPQVPRRYNISPGNKGCVCSELNGAHYFAPTKGGNIVFINSSDSQLKNNQIIVYSLTNTEFDDMTFNEMFKLTYKIPQYVDPAKNGIREVIQSGTVFTIYKNSAQWNRDDSGANANILAINEGSYSDLQSFDDYSLIADGELSVEISANDVKMFLLKAPYLLIDTGKILTANKDKETKLQITIKDDKATTGVSATASIFVYEKSTGAVQIDNIDKVLSGIEIDANSNTKLNFDYSAIQVGNSVKSTFDFKDNSSVLKVDTSSVTQKQSFTFSNGDLIENLTAFSTDGASAFAFDSVNNQEDIVKFYACRAENKFSTVCDKKGEISLHGLIYNDKVVSNKGITFVTAKKPLSDTVFSSFFTWFNHKTGVWDYELYKQDILDFAIADSVNGDFFTAIAFKSYVQFAQFYKNYTFGNRNIVTIDKDDVGLSQFCPKRVFENPRNPNLVWIFTDCEDEQHLVSVYMDAKQGTYKVESVRWLSDSNNIQSYSDICVIGDEIIFY
jgi:hypothetical protein